MVVNDAPACAMTAISHSSDWYSAADILSQTLQGKVNNYIRIYRIFLHVDARARTLTTPARPTQVPASCKAPSSANLGVCYRDIHWVSPYLRQGHEGSR